MNLILNNLLIPIEEDGMASYHRAACRQLAQDQGVTIVKILSKALDLRDQNQFYYRISLVVAIGDDFANREKFSLYTEAPRPSYPATRGRNRPVIVGFGPAGMFAALELIACGLKPLIFERGKKIEERSADVQHFIRQRRLNPESNIQFGEGGAGSYSDGKLFSRRHNNTSYVNRVLRTFVQFGAPPEIEYISKPHLGTDLLCKIVRNIRLSILERGGEIHYSSKLTDIVIKQNRATGIVINDEQEYGADSIYLALGHSARDTYRMLARRGVALEQRPISVGVRIEHPAETINLMRYGKKYSSFPGLGAATYSLNYTNRLMRRGVYTFCMCPGGEVVNASSEHGQLVLNGMSYSRRASPFSNAALVVNCHPEDYGSSNALAGLEFQRSIESRAFVAGGGTWQVPAQNLLHFLGKEGPGTLRQTSCRLGTVPADLKSVFPSFVVEQLMAAFTRWQEEVPLFVSEQAVLLAAETRTSSPVRIVRNDIYESINVQGLYPIGEGAGYTGGITSSAADAIRAVERQMQA